MRIGVVGAGGVGGYFGGMLANAGHDVVLVARGAHAANIKQNGLVIEGPKGRMRTSLTCVEDPAGQQPVDALLFCVKAYDVNTAAKIAERLIDSDSAIVTLQNGLDSAERFQASLSRPLALALPGSAYVSAKVTEPGVIANTSAMSALVFGSLTGDIPINGRRLPQACKESGLGAEITNDIIKELWIKFILTASTAGLATLGRVPKKVLFSNAPLRALTISAMGECLRVAAAENVELPTDLLERSLKLADSFPDDMYASMCLDLLAGRRLELDVFSSAVVERAERHGLDAPIHRYIYSGLKPLSGSQ